MPRGSSLKLQVTSPPNILKILSQKQLSGKFAQGGKKTKLTIYCFPRPKNPTGSYQAKIIKVLKPTAKDRGGSPNSDSVQKKD